MTVHTLVVGVGNPTRRDDGAGLAVARRLAALSLPGVEVLTTQQLQVELADEFAAVDRVVIVDASVTGDAVGLEVVHPGPAVPPRDAGSPTLAPTMSHHLSPALLLTLTERLYGCAPELVLCTVRGEEFDFGDSLSALAETRVNEATRRVIAALGATGGLEADRSMRPVP